MKRLAYFSIAGTLLVLLAAVIGTARAQTGGDFDLSWSSVDGGGGTSQSDDGQITLHGTIGQSDTSSVPLTGDGFTLQGGFQAGFVSGGPPPPVCGDQNGDGQVTILDAIIDLQIAMGLIEPSAEQLELSDVVQDGAINIFDVALALQHIAGLTQITQCGPLA